jgi:hypothetical protein
MLTCHSEWPRLGAGAATKVELIYSRHARGRRARNHLIMQLTISVRDKVLARYGNALAALGEGKARTALSRALNHEGDKGRTQVKHALVKQTGIKYGAVNNAMATIRATPATLTYTLKARGGETNIAWFGGVQRRKGVSAAPWKKRRIFARSFIVPRFGRAFIRTSKSRLPIRPLYGPNLARELVKDSSAAAWQSGVANVVVRVGHEIGRMLPR